LTIKSNGERKENSSFFPLSRKFEKTNAMSCRFSSAFERSKSSTAREVSEIRLSSAIR